MVAGHDPSATCQVDASYFFPTLKLNRAIKGVEHQYASLA
jgi:hypothetical protein